MKALHDGLAGGLGPHWQRFLAGQGSLEFSGESLRLVNQDTTARTYSNAQIDDYQRLRRGAFLWRPPLRFTVAARFSHGGPLTIENGPRLGGTAGFGFWNDPFVMTGLRVPTLPRALWFFYGSPPSDMKLDLDTPGYGWKAATIDALGPAAFGLAPAALLAVPLMNIRSFYRRLWPPIQRALHICEAPVDASMTDWHTYGIEWGVRFARFSVDGRAILSCDTAPRGPLGLVLWLDNQYLVARPWGRFGYGYLSKPGKQWLELASLSVEPF